MRRLPPLDRFLLAILVPIALLALVLHVRDVAQGRGSALPVDLEMAAADGYPMVLRTWPGMSAERAGLEPGDRLLQLGSLDLRGANWLRIVRDVMSGDPRQELRALKSGS